MKIDGWTSPFNWPRLTATAALCLLYATVMSDPTTPATSSRPDDARLMQGMEQIQMRQFGTARKTFQVVLDDGVGLDDAAAPNILMAHYGLCLIAQYDESAFDRDRAMERWQALHDLIPESNPSLRADTLIQKAECLTPDVHDDADKARALRERAVPIYERAMAATEGLGLEQGVVATIGYAQTLRCLDPKGAGERVVAALESLLDEDLPDGARSLLYQALAGQNALDHNWSEAERYNALALEIGIASEQTLPFTLYTQARINHIELGRLARAIMYYERVADEYPDQMFAGECRKMARKLRERLNRESTMQKEAE